MLGGEACLWSRERAALGQGEAGGSAPEGDVCSGEGLLLVPGGGCIPACNGVDHPVNRITDTCKNITLPQLRCGRQ